eukprot:scaffold26304_cov67-Isochrysis_galbana.AAC.1
MARPPAGRPRVTVGALRVRVAVMRRRAAAAVGLALGSPPAVRRPPRAARRRPTRRVAARGSRPGAGACSSRRPRSDAALPAAQRASARAGSARCRDSSAEAASGHVHTTTSSSRSAAKNGTAKSGTAKNGTAKNGTAKNGTGGEVAVEALPGGAAAMEMPSQTAAHRCSNSCPGWPARGVGAAGSMFAWSRRRATFSLARARDASTPAPSQALSAAGGEASAASG